MVTDNRIPYEELEHLLRQWGFEVERMPHQIVFHREQDDTLVALPPYATHERIRDTHLVGIRKVLVERGIVLPEAFDRELETARTLSR